MGRIARIPINQVQVSAAQDLFSIKAAKAKGVRIHGFYISQSSDFGDAQEEGMVLALKRFNSAATQGSGGSSATAVPQMTSDTLGFTARINDTTRSSGGSPTVEEPHTWNVRVPYCFFYPPELRPYIAPDELKTLELVSPGADAVTLTGWMAVEEEG